MSNLHYKWAGFGNQSYYMGEGIAVNGASLGVRTTLLPLLCSPLRHSHTYRVNFPDKLPTFVRPVSDGLEEVLFCSGFNIFFCVSVVDGFLNDVRF